MARLNQSGQLDRPLHLSNRAKILGWLREQREAMEGHKRAISMSTCANRLSHGAAQRATEASRSWPRSRGPFSRRRPAGRMTRSWTSASARRGCGSQAGSSTISSKSGMSETGGGAPGKSIR